MRDDRDEFALGLVGALDLFIQLRIGNDTPRGRPGGRQI